MKKSTSLFLGLVILVIFACFITVTACDSHKDSRNDEEDGYYSKGLSYYLDEKENGYFVGDFGDCEDFNVVIPKEYNSKPVIGIGEQAFRNCINITSITIPQSVESIGKGAFYGCEKLIEVYNKSSLNITVGSADYGYVGWYAKNVYTKKGESKLSTDENGFVVYTDGDERILVSYVGSESNLTLSNNINQIYQFAFCDCINLISVTIPESIMYIGPKAFYGCLKLIEVCDESQLMITKMESESEIPYNNGGVARYSKNVYTKKGESKLSTDDNGFVVYADGSDKLLVDYVGTEKNMVIPAGITEVYQYAFYNRSDLVSVSIGIDVSTIGTASFAYCYALTSVVIPESVTNIEDGSFYCCEKLVEVYNKSALPITAGRDSYGSIGIYALNIYTNDGESKLSTDDNGFIILDDDNFKYLISYVGNDKEISLPSGIDYINRNAFDSYTDLVSVIIPDGVVGIGPYAFRGCEALKNVTIGKDVESICISAFAYCVSLNSIYIPDNVLNIFEFAFLECKNLTNIYIGNGVISVGMDAFTGTAWYENQSNGLVYVGNVLYDYKGRMSENCSLIIKDGTVSIEDFVLSNYKKLKSVTIPNSIKYIGRKAFAGCVELSNFIYNGTIEEWNSIKKMAAWNYGALFDKIICLDGEITSLN